MILPIIFHWFLISRKWQKWRKSRKLGSDDYKVQYLVDAVKFTMVLTIKVAINDYI